MDISQFKGKTTEEIQNELSAMLDENKAKLDAMTDEATLKELEESVDKEQADFDEYLKSVNYTLSTDDVDFEDKKMKVSDLKNAIIYFLNRTEVDFQYALGLHGLIKIWKTTPLTEISYGAYDSTLRLLGQQKYKGNSEWINILSINNYLARAHEEYFRDRSVMVYLAEYRNAIVNRIQLIHKEVETTSEEADTTSKKKTKKTDASK